MFLEAFSLIYDVWREVKKEFREELKAKGIKRARLPHLAVLHDVNGVLAYYHTKTNTIVVSAKKIGEIAEKWKFDARCVAKSILYHELAHFYYTKIAKAGDHYSNSEEKDAETWEFATLATCLATR